MAMDSTAQHCNQELMCSQSETLESMLNVCTKSNQAKTKPKPCDQQALKCPRCDSNNTKFCYYNNYSLTQPRYFCKSCRRYWTKGGTLRNVPVGGGCRKNKRSTSSSSSSSKSRISQDHNQPMITTPPNFPDWINPNIPIISSTDHYNDHHANIGGGAGIFDALRGTGLFNLETPSRNVCYGLMENSNGSAGGLGHEEMGLNYINSHNYLVGFDEEYLSGAGAGAVNFPWQMMASSNGINGHGLLNTPLM